jgi:hypothetical protein
LNRSKTLDRELKAPLSDAFSFFWSGANVVIGTAVVA